MVLLDREGRWARSTMGEECDWHGFDFVLHK